MSDALVWSVLLKNNCKSMRRANPLSRTTLEKGSLRNVRTRMDGGFARTDAVDVAANDDGIPVLSLRNRDPTAQRQPDKMWRAITLSGGVRKAVKKADKILSTYDPKIRQSALAKVSAVYQAHGRKNRGVDHTSAIASQ